MEGHENTSTAFGLRAFTTKALDLAIRLNLVILQDRHFDLLTLVLDLLGSLISRRVRNRVLPSGKKTGSRCRSSSSSS